MEENEFPLIDRVVRVLVLPACGTRQVRDAIEYLRKRFPHALIALFADAAPLTRIEVDEAIPPSVKNLLKKREFDLVVLLHWRGRQFSPWLNRLANSLSLGPILFAVGRKAERGLSR